MMNRRKLLGLPIGAAAAVAAHHVIPSEALVCHPAVAEHKRPCVSPQRILVGQYGDPDPWRIGIAGEKLEEGDVVTVDGGIVRKAKQSDA